MSRGVPSAVGAVPDNDSVDVLTDDEDELEECVLSTTPHVFSPPTKAVGAVGGPGCEGDKVAGGAVTPGRPTRHVPTSFIKAPVDLSAAGAAVRYIESVPPSKGVIAPLTDTQVQSVKHVMTCFTEGIANDLVTQDAHTKAAIVANDPGSGKSRIALEVCSILSQVCPQVAWVMIIAPASVAQATWPDEVKKHNQQTGVVLISHFAHTADEKARRSWAKPVVPEGTRVVYFVTNPETLAADYNAHLKRVDKTGYRDAPRPWYATMHWLMTIVDEADALLRNATTVSHQVCAYFLSLARYRLAMSGTIFNNDIADVTNVIAVLGFQATPAGAAAADSDSLAQISKIESRNTLRPQEGSDGLTAEDVQKFFKALRPGYTLSQLQSAGPIGAAATSPKMSPIDVLCAGCKFDKNQRFVPAFYGTDAVAGMEAVYRARYQQELWAMIGRWQTTAALKLDTFVQQAACRFQFCPDFECHVEHVELLPTTAEKTAYLQQLRRVQEQLELTTKGASADHCLLPAITKLGQAIVHPALCGADTLHADMQHAVAGEPRTPQGSYNAHGYAKYSWVLKHVESTLTTPMRTIVASRWTKDLDLLYAALTHRFTEGELVVMRIDGNLTSWNMRVAHVVTSFNATELDDRRVVLLLNIEAGGTGLNLQSARELIFLTAHFNQARISQTIGRIFRQGQRAKHPHVYFLWIKFTGSDSEEALSSIETMMRNIFESKIAQMKGVLGDHFAISLQYAREGAARIQEQCRFLVSCMRQIEACPVDDSQITAQVWTKEQLTKWGSQTRRLLFPRLEASDAPKCSDSAGSLRVSSGKRSTAARPPTSVPSNHKDGDSTDDDDLPEVPFKTRRVLECKTP